MKDFISLETKREIWVRITPKSDANWFFGVRLCRKRGKCPVFKVYANVTLFKHHALEHVKWWLLLPWEFDLAHIFKLWFELFGLGLRYSIGAYIVQQCKHHSVSIIMPSFCPAAHCWSIQPQGPVTGNNAVTETVRSRPALITGRSLIALCRGQDFILGVFNIL